MTLKNLSDFSTVYYKRLLPRKIFPFKYLSYGIEYQSICDCQNETCHHWVSIADIQ